MAGWIAEPDANFGLLVIGNEAIPQTAKTIASREHADGSVHPTLELTVRSGLRGAIYASVAGLALTHTVGKAMWAGLLTSGAAFLRTPKCEDSARFSQVLRVVWQEAVLLALLLVAMTSMLFDRGLIDPAMTLWMVMLAVQSLPYAATFITASISAMSNRAAEMTPEQPAIDPAVPKAA